MPTQVDRESAADSPSQCVAAAAPSVVDGGRVAQMVSRGLKRLQIVQNNVEDVPPAVPPPDEIPIPMVVALKDRSESSDALSDGSTMDTVIFEGDSEAGAEEFLSLQRRWSLLSHERQAFASLDEVDPCAQFSNALQ